MIQVHHLTWVPTTYHPPPLESSHPRKVEKKKKKKWEKRKGTDDAKLLSTFPQITPANTARLCAQKTHSGEKYVGYDFHELASYRLRPRGARRK